MPITVNSAELMSPSAPAGMTLGGSSGRRAYSYSPDMASGTIA
jgi:hypothetical protein